MTRDDIMDSARFVSLVVNSTPESGAKATADAIDEQAKREKLADEASAALVRLSGSLNQIKKERDAIRDKQSPQAREKHIVEALAGTSDDRERLSRLSAEFDQHGRFLADVERHGWQVTQPRLMLAKLRAAAEQADAVAAVAGCRAVQSAVDAYIAGAALRAVEGTTPLYSPRGKTADLVEEARRLYSIATTHWSGVHDEERRQGVTR